jgi:outer membrane protein OmpA-like peptidoglycan-associated protein
LVEPLLKSMPKYLLIGYLFFSLAAFAQKKTLKVGDRVNISADLYNDLDAPVATVIPKGQYTLYYHYAWTGRDHDTKDSIAKIEAVITKLLNLYKINNLRVIVCSYDKGSNYRIWLENMKEHKPFKPKNRCNFECYNTDDYHDVTKSLELLFDKISFIDPNAKLLAKSSSIDDFGKQIVDLPGVSDIKLRAKLLTDSGGIKVPLVKTIVCFVNELKTDTFAKTRTDEHGDFEMILPENLNSKYELAVKQNGARPVSVVLAAQNGIEIGEFEKHNGEFTYKLLQADVNRLQEIVSSDIHLAFNNFKKGTETQLKVIEYIVYGSGKFNVEESAEVVLKKVLKIMKENPNVKLEIVSHTDSQGDDAKNMALSEKRSNAVMNYLIKNGISVTRLVSYGKGETMIRNRCGNNVECSDKEHEYNRRTEFNFTKMWSYD